MIGIIDVGGGLRGAFGAGVLDYAMEHELFFDYCAGVSAGSGNLSSYVSNQKGRLMDFYIKYPREKEYMGLRNFLKTGSFLNLDYIYETLSLHDGPSPYDYRAMCQSKSELCIVATDAISGQPHYFSKKDMRYDDYSPIKCGSCIPVINQPYEYLGHKYFDGALSDPIPYEKVLEFGCEKIVVVLTRPKNYRRTDTRDRKLARFIERQYPKASRLLANRAQLYNRKLEEIIKMEKEGRVLVLAPDSIEGMGTLTKKEKPILQLYQKGYSQAS
ncbi:MAG: patatin family protein, partial [Erysipelotrichaceae bacterium]|nr:patatin family protein [Erysipelotrichaceae bacterium]